MAIVLAGYATVFIVLGVGKLAHNITLNKENNVTFPFKYKHENSLNWRFSPNSSDTYELDRYSKHERVTHVLTVHFQEEIQYFFCQRNSYRMHIAPSCIILDKLGCRRGIKILYQADGNWVPFALSGPVRLIGELVQ